MGFDIFFFYKNKQKNKTKKHNQTKNIERRFLSNLCICFYIHAQSTEQEVAHNKAMFLIIVICPHYQLLQLSRLKMLVIGKALRSQEISLPTCNDFSTSGFAS